MQKDIQEVMNLVGKKYGSVIFEDGSKLACILEDVAPWLVEEIRTISTVSMKKLIVQLIAGTYSSREKTLKSIFDEISQKHSADQKILENCFYIISSILNKQSQSRGVRENSITVKDEGRVRKLSDNEMKQEIRAILRYSNGLNDANICPKLSARGVDSSFYKRAVTQMVIKGEVEYKSNKLYLKGSSVIQSQIKPTNLINVAQSSFNKDSEDAIRNEIIRLLRLSKNVGLTNAQLVYELENKGYSTRWFDRIRTRLVVERIAEYRGNKLYIIR